MNTATSILTTAEVARLMRVDPKTVTRWDKAGQLHSIFRTPGGHRRYALADIAELRGQTPVQLAAELNGGAR